MMVEVSPDLKGKEIKKVYVCWGWGCCWLKKMCACSTGLYLSKYLKLNPQQRILMETHYVIAVVRMCNLGFPPQAIWH